MLGAKCCGGGRLRLIETPAYSGYYLSDINDALTRAQREVFTEWFSGQTGVFHEGRHLVYKWDWDKFVEEQQQRVREASEEKAALEAD